MVSAVGTGAVAGRVALFHGTDHARFLPEPAQRNQPDPLPALLIGQLAGDRRYQERGIARSLLWLALTTAVRFSRNVGCFGILVHPLDDALRVFYGRFGFEDLLFDPGRVMIVRMVDLEHNGLQGSRVCRHRDKVGREVALTKNFRVLVQKRMAAEPAFGKALFRESVDAMLASDVDTCKAILRDYIKATTGFERLGAEKGHAA